MNQPHASLQPEDLELIAAFIDGGLAGAERDRVAARIADDPTWREVFVETRELMGLLRDEASDAAPGTPPVRASPTDEAPLPAPAHFRPRSQGGTSPPEGSPIEGAPASGALLQRAWMAAAAAIVLAGATAPFWLRMVDRGPQSTLQMVEAARGADALPDDWQENGWPRFRGDANTAVNREVDFRTGVLMVQLATVRSQPKLSLPILTQLMRQKDDDGYGPGILVESEAQAFTETPNSAVTYSALDQALLLAFEDSPWFLAGRWAGGARLAAQTGNDDHFSSKAFRDGLEALLELDLEEAPASSLEALQARDLDAERAQRPLFDLVKLLGGGRLDLESRRVPRVDRAPPQDSRPSPLAPQLHTDQEPAPSSTQAPDDFQIARTEASSNAGARSSSPSPP